MGIMPTPIIQKVSSALTKVLPPLQSDREVAQFTRENIQPIAPAVPDDVANRPQTMLDPPGIDYRREAQLALLSSFRSERHQALFQALREDQVINKLGFGSPGVSNTYCNTPDAEIYGAMILDRKPRRIVEVGSGFSTLIARDWRPNDILFIDSSHICRTRGDLPYLFCRVIPSLPAGVLVHVHDIFLPFDYPNLYDQWCHTEEYLLACMLSHSKRYRVVLATHWLSRTEPAAMNAAFGPLAGSAASAPHHLGCSFWLEVVAS
jgi:hypothetical protein